jgi:hypothetical protein
MQLSVLCGCVQDQRGKPGMCGVVCVCVCVLASMSAAAMQLARFFPFV